MPDKFSKEIRRKTMQAVKSKDTELENVVMRNLWSKGIRFRRNVSDLLGTHISSGSSSCSTVRTEEGSLGHEPAAV